MFLHENYFNKEGDLLTVKRSEARARLMPKGFIVCDFSPSENLLEIEDESDGARFWADSKEIMKAEYIPGKEYNVLRPDGSAIIVEFKSFTTTVYKKRCYVCPVFKIKGYAPKYELNRNNSL